ncbi:unnamed protein product [Calicophoron daubneyi]|uniref:C2H2-type domain-containing protein n=1 Tax=Calicophoron daubneyi TaxID=300641 RepID=A0AAV2TGE2_CALDB
MGFSTLFSPHHSPTLGIFKGIPCDPETLSECSSSQTDLAESLPKPNQLDLSPSIRAESQRYYRSRKSRSACYGHPSNFDRLKVWRPHQILPKRRISGLMATSQLARMVLSEKGTIDRTNVRFVGTDICLYKQERVCRYPPSSSNERHSRSTDKVSTSSIYQNRLDDRNMQTLIYNRDNVPEIYHVWMEKGQAGWTQAATPSICDISDFPVTRRVTSDQLIDSTIDHDHQVTLGMNILIGPLPVTSFSSLEAHLGGMLSHICPATFIWHAERTEHLRLAHGIQKTRKGTRIGKAGRICCDHCDYKTKHAKHLRQHVRVHWSVKPFACLFCQYRSRWKGAVKRHAFRKHPGIFDTEAFCLYGTQDESKCLIENTMGNSREIPSEQSVNGPIDAEECELVYRFSFFPPYQF